MQMLLLLATVRINANTKNCRLDFIPAKIRVVLIRVTSSLPRQTVCNLIRSISPEKETTTCVWWPRTWIELTACSSIDVQHYLLSFNHETETINVKKHKSFQSLMAHWAALISVSLALSQTPVSTLWDLSLIHIWRCRRIERCRSRWSPYH